MSFFLSSLKCPKFKSLNTDETRLYRHKCNNCQHEWLDPVAKGSMAGSEEIDKIAAIMAYEKRPLP